MLPRLHAVTDDAVLARADFVDLARRVLGAGGARVALHLRGPATHGARLFDLARQLRGTACAAEALLLANDRVDLALAAGLDGVQLGERSLPARVARRLLPPGARIGVSVHDAERARAERADADYLVVGTLFATPSHPGRAGVGVAGLRRVGASVALPLVAIGGITPERVPEVLEGGAYGVAAVSGIWAASDPGAAVARYLEAL